MCDAMEMPKYIGVKIVWAIPMTREAFEAKHGRNVGGDKHGEGYEVTYGGGYQAWSPKDVFDAAYHPTTCRTAEENIARVCHEVNRAYCQAMGDDSQPTWEDAPQWQKDSAMLGVQLHMSGDHGPEASHESWRTQKFNDGWRWGPEKNPEKKEHPCMVDFSDLPKEQQAKDFLFRAVVHALSGRS